VAHILAWKSAAGTAGAVVADQVDDDLLDAGALLAVGAVGGCAGYLTHPWASAGRRRLTSRAILAFPGMDPATVRE
jgi:hypothetical protein